MPNMAKLRHCLVLTLKSKPVRSSHLLEPMVQEKQPFLRQFPDSSGLRKEASPSWAKPIENKKAEKIVHMGISHVPEGRMVFTQRTVKTNLQMGAFGRKDKAGIKQDMDKYYEMFPILGERSNQRAGTLSGGEQQMLAIARALMKRPKLLLLDEPSMGLAPFLVNNIFKTIKKLNEEGLSILLVEQNVKKALKITQRAYVIELGKIVHTRGFKRVALFRGVRKSYLGET